MKSSFKFILKIVAAIFVVSAAVSTVFIFRTELTDLFDDVKQKIGDRRNCCSDFEDFDDI